MALRKFKTRPDRRVVSECPTPLPDHPGEQAVVIAAWIASLSGVRLARWWRSDRQPAAAPVTATTIIRVYVEWATPYSWNNGTGTSLVEIVPRRKFDHRDPPTLRDPYGAAVEFSAAPAESVAAIARAFGGEMTR